MDFNEGQNALAVPDLFHGLDTSTSMDMFPKFSLVTPESTTNAADLTSVDFMGLLEEESPQSAPGECIVGNSRRTPPSASLEDVERSTLSSKDNLPEDALLHELVNRYFDQHHMFLPFLHKSRYLKVVEYFNRDYPDRQEAALLHAVIAVAAASHPDSTVRDHQVQWFTRAKQLCEDTRERKYPSLQGIQASLCITILGWTTGDYPLSWLYIGTAWRQACTLGLNRVDGEQTNALTNNCQPSSAIALEERRRTMWVLFLMDRGMAFPAGWPHAIDDRQFMVNLPVDDNMFQRADEDVSLNRQRVIYGAYP